MHDFLLVFHCNYISILQYFRHTVDYFPKFKRSRDHDNTNLRDYMSIRSLVLYMASRCTKFEVSSLSCSTDILGVLKINKKPS